MARGGSGRGHARDAFADFGGEGGEVILGEPSGLRSSHHVVRDLDVYKGLFL